MFDGLEELLPPIMFGYLRVAWHKAKGRKPEWEYWPGGWKDAPPVRGWDVDPMLDVYRSGWQRWRASMEGARLRIAALERKGWHQAGYIDARNSEEAEARFAFAAFGNAA